MAGELIIGCPTCDQKYRIKLDRIGRHAVCKKCHQRFRIQPDDPIDDETILGWVMEEGTPEQSVMGSTSIFRSTKVPKTRPTLGEWTPPPPPERPRVKLDHIDDNGAHFEFPAKELNNADVRKSFPLKCVHCLSDSQLEVHLVIWGEKLPRQDAFHRNELRDKAFGRLDQLLRTQQKRWFDHLEPMTILPPPFCNPFPYFVCSQCKAAGEITGHTRHRNGEDVCQITIAKLDLALEFFTNNGGQSAMNYRSLADAAQRQRDDRWRRLSLPVRTRISTWFKPGEGEKFHAYFADSDFARAETGTAGVVLTNKRLVYKKYAATREYAVGAGGNIEIHANHRKASIRISQSGHRDATLHASPHSASRLAKALSKLDKPWRVKVETDGKS